MLGCRVSGFRAWLLVTWIEAAVHGVLSTNAACKVFPLHTRLTARLSCAGTDFRRPANFQGWSSRIRSTRNRTSSLSVCLSRVH